MGEAEGDNKETTRGERECKRGRVFQTSTRRRVSLPREMEANMIKLVTTSAMQRVTSTTPYETFSRGERSGTV